MKVILSLCLLCLAHFINAQQWIQQHQAIAIKDILFWNHQTGWATGAGQILKTTNGGQDWLPKLDMRINEIIDMAFSDHQHGWILGVPKANPQTKILLHSHDGGIHWEPINNMDYSDFNSLAFTDHLNGWIVGDAGKILHTTDGGQTWTPQPSTVLTGLNDVVFLDQHKGWAAGNNHQILKTLDGGNTWTKISNSFTGILPHFSGLFVLDPDHIWAYGTSGDIFGTSNGGQSWQDYSTVNEQVNSVHFINEDEGWAVTSNRVIQTTNGGHTWTTISNFSGQQIHFSTEMHGVLIRHSKLYTTEDGGATWQSTPESVFGKVYFLDSTDGIYVDNGYGQVLKTYNGGLEWELNASSLQMEFSNLLFENELHGYCVGVGAYVFGRASSIYETHDGGNTWSPVFHGNYFITDLTQVWPNTLYAVGHTSFCFGCPDVKGAVLKSTNNGQSWTVLTENLEYRLTNMHCFDSNHCIYTANDPGNSILIDDNSAVIGELTLGNHFNLIQEKPQESFTRLQFVNENLGYALALHYNNSVKVYKTTDGGNSWNARNLPIDLTPDDLFFLNETTGWVTVDSLIYQTQNGGQSWTPKHTLPDDVFTIYVNDAHHAWIGRYTGIYFLDNVTSLHPIVKEKEKPLIFPNPTTGIFNIENQQPCTTLEIFSTTGQLLTAIELDHTGSVEIDISKYPKSVYFLKISNENGLFTQQLVLR